MCVKVALIPTLGCSLVPKTARFTLLRLKMRQQVDIYLKINISETQLQYYRFMGLLLGKALAKGILIDAPFASFFLSKWLNQSCYCKFTTILYFYSSGGLAKS